MRIRTRTDNDDDNNDDDDNDDDDDDYDDGDDNNDGDDDHDDHDHVRWWEVERGHMSNNFPSYKLTSREPMLRQAEVTNLQLRGARCSSNS